jgi:hypothetical protein
MRRRLHVGLSRAIRTISSTMTGSSGGRPAQRDRRAQKRTKPRRTLPERDGGVSRKRGFAAPRPEQPELLVEVGDPDWQRYYCRSIFSPRQTHARTPNLRRHRAGQ